MAEDYIGKQVRLKTALHGKPNIGFVVQLNKGIITIDFAGEVKRFPFPGAFKSNLEFVDESTSESVVSDLQICEAEQRQKLKEQIMQAEGALHAKKQFQKMEKVSSPISACHNVAEFLTQSTSAISQEIQTLRTDGGKKYVVFNGNRVAKDPSKSTYLFETDTELHFPNGTLININLNHNATLPGVVVTCEDFNIYIAAQVDLGENVGELEFSAEPWQLLESLIKRLEECLASPSKIVDSLITDGNSEICEEGLLNCGKEAAVYKSCNEPITFIWGPPGTGKTETLAEITATLVNNGKRVLMLSYSNVSVDGATMRVNRKMGVKVKPGVIVRYGYPQDKALLSHEYLTTSKLVILRHPDLMEEQSLLIKRKQALSKADKEYLAINKRLAEIREALLIEEKEAVWKAKFVATTVSKAVVDKTIYSQQFDAVIFDEASMAYIPQVIFAASLAKEHFCCMGDFCQLPPISQTPNHPPMLTADIFGYTGITEAIKMKHAHDWLVLLDTQYRMHPEIAAFASVNMYRGLLKSAEDMEEKCKKITKDIPLPGSPLVLVDMSNMMSVCNRTTDNSRANVLSAFISAKIAMCDAQQHKVSVITPYRAQSKLVFAMLRDIAGQNPNLNEMSCATVHQFQGSEQDVIIYDAVDCYREKYLSRLLVSMENNSANRLFNVALTRTKGKFIAVANENYLKSKSNSSDLMFWELMKKLDEENKRAYGDSLLQMLIDRDENKSTSFAFFTETSGFNQFLEDIRAAKMEVRIDIPGELQSNDDSNKQLAGALGVLREKGVKIFMRAEHRDKMPLQLIPFAINYKYVENPVVLIDKHVIWFGEPASNARFTAEMCNVIRYSRPVIRFEGQYTARTLFGLLEMSKTVDDSKAPVQPTDTSADISTYHFSEYVLQHAKCKARGNAMMLKKSNKGGYYLYCVNHPECSETELVGLDLINRYLLSKDGPKCIQDHTSLEAKIGRHGPYIQCCSERTRHFYNLDEI